MRMEIYVLRFVCLGYESAWLSIPRVSLSIPGYEEGKTAEMSTILC